MFIGHFSKHHMSLKKIILKIPFVGAAFYRLRQEMWRRESAKKFAFQRMETGVAENDLEMDLIKIRNLLNYTKTSESLYSANQFPAGYHTLRIRDHEFKGQRDPSIRFEKVRFDFAGKSVLDIGCNQGGMLFAILARLPPIGPSDQ